MIEQIYTLGARARLRELGMSKEAGAQHVVGGALGALLGSAIGAGTLPALGDPPEGIMGFPPTAGQLDYDLKRKAQLGSLLGALAGAGLGAASPMAFKLLKKLRGESIAKALG